MAVPGWSGKFIEVAHEDRGLLPVHMDDLRMHRAPEGWRLEDIYVLDDGEVHLYRRHP